MQNQNLKKHYTLGKNWTLFLLLNPSLRKTKLNISKGKSEIPLTWMAMDQNMKRDGAFSRKCNSTVNWQEL